MQPHPPTPPHLHPQQAHTCIHTRPQTHTTHARTPTQKRTRTYVNIRVVQFGVRSKVRVRGLSRILTNPINAGTKYHILAHAFRCDDFSGADMASLVREACVLALKESMRNAAATIAAAVPSHTGG